MAAVLSGVIQANSAKHLQEILRNYEEQTHSHFVLKYSDKKFFEDDLVKLSEVNSSQRIQWSLSAITDKGLVLPFNGVPFIFLGNRTLACHHGPDLNLSTKIKQRTNRIAKSIDGQAALKHRYLVQPTKKMDCPVVIHMKKIVTFPDFRIDIDSEYSRRCTAKLLKEALEQREVKKEFESESVPVKMELLYYARLPDPLTHENHILMETEGIREPLRGRAKRNTIPPDKLPHVTSEQSSADFKAVGSAVFLPVSTSAVQPNIFSFNTLPDQTSGNIYMVTPGSVFHTRNTSDMIDACDDLNAVKRCESDDVTLEPGNASNTMTVTYLPSVETVSQPHDSQLDLGVNTSVVLEQVSLPNVIVESSHSYSLPYAAGNFVPEDAPFSAAQPSEFHQTRYFQSSLDLAIFLAKSRLAARYAKIDDECVRSFITNLQPENHCALYSSTEVTSDSKIHIGYAHVANFDDDVDAECRIDVPEATMMFVYQSAEMKRLYHRYGNQLVLLEAVYRAGRYPLPLFFVSVRTNVNYQIVAVFVIQNETLSHIATALQTLREWNPEVCPRLAMVDSLGDEVTALEMTFPGIQVNVCDYHREQCWHRWIAVPENGVGVEAENLKMKLRRVAVAISADDAKRAVTELESSACYTACKRFVVWFQNKWKPHITRWCSAYRSSEFQLALMTNNGIKHLNEDFVYRFLDDCRDSTLSELVAALVARFLPAQYRTYVELNVRSSSLYRKYSDDVPPYLRNRPRRLIDDMRKKLISLDPNVVAAVCQKNDKNGVFAVPASNGRPPHEVVFGDDTTCCSCTCISFHRTRLLCKHFCAVFQAFSDWPFDRVSSLYTQNPLLILDEGIVGSGNASDGVELLPNLSDKADNAEMQVENDAVAGGEETENNVGCVSTGRDSVPERTMQAPVVLRKSTLKSDRTKVRSVLRNLLDLTGTITDAGAMRDMRTRLEEVYHEAAAALATVSERNTPVRTVQSLDGKKRRVGRPVGSRGPKWKSRKILEDKNVKIVEIQVLDGRLMGDFHAEGTTFTLETLQQ